MRISVKYFGIIAERTAKDIETFNFTDACDKNILRALIENKYNLEGIHYSIAINRKISNNLSITENDEVALLPPFAGG